MDSIGIRADDTYFVGEIRDAGTGVHYGDTAPMTFQRGGKRGHRCPYIPLSHVIS